MNKLKLSDNRLMIAWGIIVVAYAIKIILIEIDAELPTREFVKYSLIKDVGALFVMWMGLTFILEREP